MNETLNLVEWAVRGNKQIILETTQEPIVKGRAEEYNKDILSVLTNNRTIKKIQINQITSIHVIP